MFAKNLNKNLQILAFGGLALALTGLALFYPTQLTAQKYFGAPVTKARLINTVKSRAASVPAIVKTIKESGVNFQLTSAVESELLAVKARPQIIEAVRNNYRAPAGVAASKPPKRTTGAVTANNNTLYNTAASQTSAQDDRQERYEELYDRGLQLFVQLQTTPPQQVNVIANQLIEIGYQGIELDKSRPEAYKLVGSGLMLNGQYEMAEEFGQKAIDRGSSLAFNVWHLSGTPHPEVLHVGKNYITVESNQKFFQFNSGEIKQVSPQGFYNVPNGSSVAVLGIATDKDNRRDEWYFTPALSGSEREVQMIMRLVKKNSSGGR